MSSDVTSTTLAEAETALLELDQKLSDSLTDPTELTKYAAVLERFLTI